jgi:hypothetical protein
VTKAASKKATVVPEATKPMKPSPYSWWLREAISDREGLADMAYIVIGALAVAAITALTFIFGMAAWDYAHCTPITTVAKGDQSVTSVIPCRFDPLPIGQAAGLIFGAFGALIGALAGYMAATKRKDGQTQ